MKKFIIGIFVLLFSVASHAQCAMCRASLESSDGTIKAESVNDGIVYLMVLPYLVVGLVGFAIYRLRQKKRAE
jgi:hypothetical protein